MNEQNLLSEAQAVNNGLKHFCFDIETGLAPQADIDQVVAEWKPGKKLKDPDSITKYRVEHAAKVQENSALLDRAPIMCIAIATEAGNIVFSCIPTKCPVARMPMVDAEIRNFGSEKAMLIELREWIAERVSEATTLIGFNIYGFDLPKLRNAYIRHKLQVPAALVPDGNPCYDVMAKFTKSFTTEFYKQPFIKLKTVQSRLGLPEYKEVINGADAPKLAAEGQDKLVIPYCYLDTMTTYLAYLYMTGQIEDKGV